MNHIHIHGAWPCSLNFTFEVQFHKQVFIADSLYNTNTAATTSIGVTET